jgi:hypothetical protein
LIEHAFVLGEAANQSRIRGTSWTVAGRISRAMPRLLLRRV